MPASTLTSVANLSAAHDTTWWLRDEATGFVTNKVYADGLGPAYDYTVDGLLLRRTWSRGIATILVRPHDSFGRPTGYAMKEAPSG